MKKALSLEPLNLPSQVTTAPRNWKAETRIDLKMKLPPITPTITIGGSWVCTEGGITIVSGEKKAGKSITLINVLATAIQPIEDEERTLTIKAETTKKRVVYVDTEQSKQRTQMFINRVLRKCGIDKEPENLEFYNIRHYSLKERMQFLKEFLFSEPTDLGLVILDGVADFVDSINNEEQSKELVDTIFSNLPDHSSLLTVIHEGKDGRGAMGHLGQLLEKKCSGMIAISKNRAKQIHTIRCRMVRDGADFEEIHFRWCDLNKDFVLLSAADQKAIAETTEADRLNQLTDLAKKCFVTNASGQTKAQVYEKIDNHDTTLNRDVKPDSLKRAIRNKFKDFEEFELIKKNKEGLYTLNINEE